MGMKLVGIPLFVTLVICVAAVLVLNISLALFLFSLFNAIILATIVGSYKPSEDEVDESWNSVHSSCEGGEDADSNHEDSNEDSDDDNNSDDDDEGEKEEENDSGGYDQDDEDSGSDGEVGWQDDEDVDDHLETRIEEFISKVIQGWREEWLKDNLHNQSGFGFMGNEM